MLLHVKEKCENKWCDITTCNLRHPRTCEFVKEYNRCKFSDYCSFKHVEINNQSCSSSEIVEKLENIAKT